MPWRSAEVSFPGQPLQVQSVQIVHVQICPCTLESLENFKNASVCTLKYNAFRPEALLLST